MGDILPHVSVDHLQLNDAPGIIWIPVQAALSLLWDENPKEHDIGLLIQSIQKYGFQELPKYDAVLGGIKAGNGRAYALALMEQNQKKDKYALPRGIARDEQTGVWVMPLLVGTDAESAELAKAYAVDSNNLTMSGGDYTAVDMLGLWERNSYLALLKDIAQYDVFSLTVSGDTLESLLRMEKEKSNLINEKDVSDYFITVKISVRNPGEITNVISAVQSLLSQNPNWEASIIE